MNHFEWCCNIANQTQVNRDATYKEIGQMYRVILKYICDSGLSEAKEWEESCSKALGMRQREDSPLVLLKCILYRTAYNSKERTMVKGLIAKHIPVSWYALVIVNLQLTGVSSAKTVRIAVQLM